MTEFLGLAALIVFVVIITPLLLAGVIHVVAAQGRPSGAPFGTPARSANSQRRNYPMGSTARSDGRDGTGWPSPTTATAHRAP